MNAYAQRRLGFSDLAPDPTNYYKMALQQSINEGGGKIPESVEAMLIQAKADAAKRNPLPEQYNIANQPTSQKKPGEYQTYEHWVRGDYISRNKIGFDQWKKMGSPTG